MRESSKNILSINWNLEVTALKKKWYCDRCAVGSASRLGGFFIGVYVFCIFPCFVFSSLPMHSVSGPSPQFTSRGAPCPFGLLISSFSE